MLDFRVQGDNIRDMETLIAFQPLFTAGIFFVGFLALLLAGFNALLNAKIGPLKENLVRFEKRLDKLEAGQASFDKRLDKLEAGQASLDKKIDQLLAAQKS